MKRTAHALGLALLLAVFAAGAAGAQTSPSPVEEAAAPSGPAVDIRTVNSDAFPTISMVVSVSGGKVTPESVRVTVNDEAVSNVAVEPLAVSGETVDVVLVIDTSHSMHGEPLEAARAAAVSFVEGLPSDIRVGVVTFADRPHVALPISTDHQAALDALGTLRTTQQTAMYDAVFTASEQFTGPGQHNIVLLSDGGDTISKHKLSDAMGAAKEKGAAIFSIGLQTKDTDVETLQALATQTGGRYAPAESADLSSIYQGLARQLSNQYGLTFSSPAGQPGEQLSLAVSAFGQSDSALVLAPESPVPASPGPPPPQGKPFFRGIWGFAVLLVVAFVATYLLVILLLGTGARAARKKDLQKRLESTGAVGAAEGTSAVWLPGVVVRAGEKAAEAGGMTGGLDSRLERAGLPIRSGEFLASSILAGAVGALVGALLLRNILFIILLAVVGGAIPWVIVSVGVGRRSKRLHAQLADVLTILASSLRAGHSFIQALDTVSKEIGQPAAEEFGRVVAEIRLGRPVEDSLTAMADRVGSADLRWTVLAVNIQREVGGNLAEILDIVAGTIRERDEIRRQIDVLTSEGKLSAIILGVLPIGIAIYISIVNPSYIGLLFGTKLGIFMLVTGISLMLLGVLWMRKIVKIDV